jgi:dTDP-4-dehydrorhamnose 3,5-epimerase
MAMNVHKTPISDAWILEPKVFEDDRGFFLESYSERTFAEIGITQRFVQDNHSCSKRGVLRGLHYDVE